jgi:hypothetical protein
VEHGTRPQEWGTVVVNQVTMGIDTVVGIASDVWTYFDDLNFSASLCQFSGHHATGKASANNQNIKICFSGH